jgi:hypothetical protein
VAVSCEHGDEPSAFKKVGEFLGWLSVLLGFLEGLCSLRFRVGL